jgi:hypothetical protein
VKLYFGKLAPSAIAATTAALGFPALNLASEQLGKPWNATGLGATDITVTLPALSTVMLVAIHDVNFATCNVQKSVDGVAWVNVGALNTYRDRHGRRRGSLLVNAAGQLALKLQIAAGVATDGLAAWRGGAVYVFTSLGSVSAVPEYGYTQRTKRPRVTTPFPNGLTATAKTGPNVDRVELSFGRRCTPNWSTTWSRRLRPARAGWICSCPTILSSSGRCASSTTSSPRPSTPSPRRPSRWRSPRWSGDPTSHPRGAAWRSLRARHGRLAIRRAMLVLPDGRRGRIREHPGGARGGRRPRGLPNRAA